MHNWRLLLLAFVAVLEPIASFTERNLVDGRQQCCDRQPHFALQDTRLSLYGSNRFSKTVSQDRHLNQRDEIRDVGRYEALSYGSELNRLSRERQRESRARYTRQEILEPAARLSRANYRLEEDIVEGTLTSQRLERVSSHTRERNNRDTRARGSFERDRSRSFTDVIHENEREIHESSRNRLSRDESRNARFHDERSGIAIDSQREARRIRSNSAEIRRPTLSKEFRVILERRREDVAQGISNNRNNRLIVREKMNVEKQSTLRRESRGQVDNNRERRSLDRRVRDILNERRRSLSSENGVTRNVQEGRIISREDPQENRNRITRQRSVTAHNEGHREQREESSRDRTLVNRRESQKRTSFEVRQLRESASRSRTEVHTRLERSAAVRPETRNERYTRVLNSIERRTILENRRLESRRLERAAAGSRDNLSADRRSRSVERLNFRDTRHAAKHRTADAILARDVPQVRVEYRNNGDKNTQRDNIDVRFRETEPARNQEKYDSLSEKQKNKAFNNWQLVFYTLQGIYLCSLFMPMVNEHGFGKPKSKGLRLWAAPSASLLKMD